MAYPHVGAKFNNNFRTFNTFFFYVNFSFSDYSSVTNPTFTISDLYLPIDKFYNCTKFEMRRSSRLEGVWLQPNYTTRLRFATLALLNKTLETIQHNIMHVKYKLFLQSIIQNSGSFTESSGVRSLKSS